MEVYLLNRALDNVANNDDVLCLIQAVDPCSSLSVQSFDAPERFEWPLISREIKVKNCHTEDNGRHLCSSGPPILNSACHDCRILIIARRRACARVSRQRRVCLFFVCKRNIWYYSHSSGDDITTSTRSALFRLSYLY